MKRALVIAVLIAGCRPQVDARRVLALTPDPELAPVQARAVKDGTPDAWVKLAEGWVRKARTTADPGFMLSANAAAELALAQTPSYRPALNVKGLALLSNHRFREAAALARQVLAVDGDDLMALGALSDSLLELGDVRGATLAVQKMLDVKPCLPSYGRASYVRWLVGDEAGAREMIRLAVDAGRGARDHEPSAWVLVQGAMLFFQRGDLEGAEAGFTAAERLVPGYPPALVGQGRVALARGDRRAVALLSQATPTVEALGLLADAQALAGLDNRATIKRMWREGDRLGMGAYLAAKNRDATQAVALLEAEHRDRPGLAVEDAYGWALYRAGRWVEARAASDRALAFGTPDARWLFHGGAIRIAQGDLQGRAMVQKALALNPHFEGAAEANTLLGLAQRP